MNKNGDVKAAMEEFMDTISPWVFLGLVENKTPTAPPMKNVLASFQLVESEISSAMAFYQWLPMSKVTNNNLSVDLPLLIMREL